MEELSNESVQLVVTSPPYWNIMKYSDQKEQIGREQPYENYLEELNLVWKECERVLAPNGKLCINTTILPLSASVFGERTRKNIPSDIEREILKKTKLKFYDLYIWDKGYFLFGNQHLMFGSYPYPPNFICRLDFEFIHVFVKPGKPKPRSIEVKEKSKLSQKEWIEFTKGVWKVSPEKDPSKGHLAPFPLEVPYRLIRMFSYYGDLLMDPFLGRGTTLKVAEFLGRKSVGYEIVRDYEVLINKFMNNVKVEEELLAIAKKYETPFIKAGQKTLDTL